MKNLKNIRRLKIIVIGFVFSIGILLQVIFMNLALNSLDNILNKKVKEVPVNQEDLTRLVSFKIPSLSIDSYVESVGLTSSGEVDVPKESLNVGWFNQSPFPGEEGNSIIVGHYGLKNYKPAAFNNLYKIQKGEKIYTENNEGKITTFVVSGIKTYKYNEYAYEVFVSTYKKAHLNLITCSGAWDEKLGTHLDRLIVFTDME